MTNGIDLSAAVHAIEQRLAATDMPGLIIGVTDRSQLLKVILHGYSDWKTRAPLTTESRLAIGSISKSFTALALLQLAAESRIDLHAPIARYLPAFSIQSEFEPITAHHLLVHSSGLPSYLIHTSSSRYVLAALRDLEASYAPGKYWSYSNTGYQLLGYVLEDLEAQSYPAIIRRRILQPLGMDSTSAVIDDEQRTGMAVSYTRWPYDGTYQEASWFEYAAGDGSLVSTVPDMCAYARLILNRGAGPHGPLLNETDFATFTTPVLGDYGYGLFVKQEQGATTVGHEGGIAGFHSVLDVHPIEGFALVMLSSSYINDDLKKWLGECVAAAFKGSTLPAAAAAVIEARKVVSTNDARHYTGLYRAADLKDTGSSETLEFIERDGSLALEEGDHVHPLRRCGPDCFRLLGDSPGLPFFFARTGKETGARAVEVSRGARWYVTQAFTGHMNPAVPADFSAYVGHFANNGPEGPVARVFVRNGRLWAMISLSEYATPAFLKPIGQGLFRMGWPAPNPENAGDQAGFQSPERVRFDTVIDGQALRMTLSGVPLYRKDTP